MTKEKIDILWQKAMQESIKDGEMFTRYHFAKLVAEKALAEHAMQEVQRLGQEIEQEPVAVYGYCPQCGAKGVMRERRSNGNDKCANGHTYPSSTSTPPQRTWVGLTKNERLELYRQFENCFESDDCEYEKAIDAKLKEKNT